MEFSKAIMIGCEKSKQSHDSFKDKITGHTCVMGAAMEGLGIKPNWDGDAKLRELYPFLDKVQEYPEGAKHYYNSSDSVRNILVYFNNHMQWTREQIAKWVHTNFEQEVSK